MEEQNTKLRDRAQTLRGLCKNAKNWESDIKSANLNLKSNLEKSNFGENDEIENIKSPAGVESKMESDVIEQKYIKGKLQLALGLYYANIDISRYHF